MADNRLVIVEKAIDKLEKVKYAIRIKQFGLNLNNELIWFKVSLHKNIEGIYGLELKKHIYLLLPVLNLWWTFM